MALASGAEMVAGWDQVRLSLRLARSERIWHGSGQARKSRYEVARRLSLAGSSDGEVGV
jgi:hypothetical protein